MVGSPIANRDINETQRMIGMFVNNIVVKGNINSEETFQEFLNKTKEQILSTVQLFKELEIIGEQKVYGIISFPRRKKMLFNDFPYRDIYEATIWVKNYGIHLIASNEVDVVDSAILTPVAYE